MGLSLYGENNPVSPMTSSRPYLIRAIYEWIVDNAMTPHLLVDVQGDAIRVPRQYVEDGKIVLNIGPAAVEKLTLGDDNVRFDARFGGEPMSVSVPVRNVLAVYTRENGQGMMFEPEEDPSPPAPDDTSGPRLRVVK